MARRAPKRGDNAVGAPLLVRLLLHDVVFHFFQDRQRNELAPLGLDVERVARLALLHSLVTPACGALGKWGPKAAGRYDRKWNTPNRHFFHIPKP